MKPTAPERFAVKAVAAAIALILSMTAQALPLSYLMVVGVVAAFLLEQFGGGLNLRPLQLLLIAVLQGARVRRQYLHLLDPDQNTLSNLTRRPS